MQDVLTRGQGLRLGLTSILSAALVAAGALHAEPQARGSADSPGRPKAAKTPKKEPPKEPAQPEAPAKDGSKDPIHEEFLRVNYLFNRELYDLAIPRYESLLAAHPDYEKIHAIRYALALSHYNLATRIRKERGAAIASATPAREGQAKTPAESPADAHLRKAMGHLREALKKKDFEPRVEATRLLGQVLLLIGDTENAAKAFRWVLDRKPAKKEASAAAVGLAESHYFQGKHSDAAAAFKTALDAGLEGEERDRAEFYLAMSLYNLGGESAGESAEIFGKLAASTSSAYAADARYMKALAQQANGNEAGAIEGFREVIGTKDGAHAELAWFGLATALFRAGQKDEAAAELQKFMETHPKSERRDVAAVYLARALLDTGKGTAAARMLQDLRASPTAGDEASLWLARLYMRHGKPRGAVDVLREALKAFPQSRHAEAMEMELASALLAEGDFQAASERLSRLEGSKGARADQLAYLKAYALHRSGKYEESRAACDRFRSEHPKSPFTKEVEQLVAENLFFSKDYAGARKAYDAYLARFGKDLDGVARAKAAFRGAHALYLAKDLQGARGAFAALDTKALGPEAEKVSREDPFFATRDYLEADIAYQLEEFEAAALRFSSFLEDPRVSHPEGGATAALEEAATDARFKLAHALQLSGKLDQARDAYLKALEAAPKTPHREQISFELAQIAYTQKDLDEAAAGFSKLLSESPSSRFAPHALRFLGWIAREKGDPAQAAKHYAKLISQFPDHEVAADAEIQLALSLQAAGRRDEARMILKRFQSKRPGDPRAARAYLEDAMGLAKEGKHSEALVLLEKLRKEGPPEVIPAALYESAWCLRATEDLDGAARAYGELMAREDAGELRETARLELAELEFDRKAYDRAKELLGPLAGGQGPHREKALYRLAWTNHMLEDAEGTIAAHDALSKEFASSPLRGEAALLAARAHLKQGDHANAGAIFKALYDATPQGPAGEAALLGFAECLVEERKLDEARKRFEAFLSRFPESVTAYRARFGLGWIDESQGRLDQAVTKYREVARSTATPTGARAQFQIGQCMAAKKDWRNAIAEFLQVPASYSHAEWTSKALLQTAGCFEALEDAENALRYYKEVIETHPDRDEAKLARERVSKLEAR